MELPEPDPGVALPMYSHNEPRYVLYQLSLVFTFEFPNHSKKKRTINKIHHLDIDFITILRGGISGGRRQEGNYGAPAAGQSSRRFGHFCRSTVYQFLHKTPIQHLDVPRLCLDRRLMLRSFLLLPPKLKVKFPSSPPEAQALSWQVTASAGQTLKFQIKKIRTN